MLENRFSADFLEHLDLIPQMKPVSNTVSQIQYTTLSFISDLQEHLHSKVKKSYFMAAGEVGGRSVVGLGDLSIDISLEVPNEQCN